MPRPARRSESVDDFIKAVYTLQQHGERVSTTTLRDTLAISAPSVTDMAQRLVNVGLIDYQKYGGVLLTPDGEAMALKIIRRHRLIELFLVREMGYALRDVHEEAERLEHAVSERFIEALSRKLGNPRFDPHGDPIPAADGSMTERALQPLTDLSPGSTGTVARLRSETADMIEHMQERGFVLGAQIVLVQHDPFDGPLTVRVNEQSRIIGHHVAACIDIETTQTGMG